MFRHWELGIAAPLDSRDDQEKRADPGCEIRLEYALAELKRHNEDEYPLLKEHFKLINADEKYKALLETAKERLAILKQFLKRCNDNVSFKNDPAIQRKMEVYRELQREYQADLLHFLNLSKRKFEEIKQTQRREDDLCGFVETAVGVKNVSTIPNDLWPDIITELKKVHISAAMQLYTSFRMPDDEFQRRLDARIEEKQRRFDEERYHPDEYHDHLNGYDR